MTEDEHVARLMKTKTSFGGEWIGAPIDEAKVRRNVRQMLEKVNG
jgi:hypothetical protein